MPPSLATTEATPKERARAASFMVMLLDKDVKVMVADLLSIVEVHQSKEQLDPFRDLFEAGLCMRIHTIPA